MPPQTRPAPAPAATPGSAPAPAGAPAPPGDGPAAGPHTTPTVARVRAGELVAVRVCGRPCRTCAWRKDNARRYRYPNLRDYLGGTVPGEPDFGRPVDGDPLSALGTMFACHGIPNDNAHLCAGWLAAHGADHPLVRLGIAWGLIDPVALTPGEDWPDLWGSAAEMLAAVGPDAPAAPGLELAEVRG
ncbi:DUF6283 family protein [Micromonospora aurantiaca (nom. illeg.)]|uniref:DUF6283 family protein n=1 Tax=Micromonospora aurantiaca (nom. illeg.) TaxID=47850 RepID=UPI00340F13E3